MDAPVIKIFVFTLILTGLINDYERIFTSTYTMTNVNKIFKVSCIDILNYIYNIEKKILIINHVLILMFQS